MTRTIIGRIFIGFVIFVGMATSTEIVLADDGSKLPPRPKLTKLPVNFDISMENTPVIFKGRTLLLQNERPSTNDGDGSNIYLYIEDIATGKRVARFGELHSFISGYVDGDVLNVFASRYTPKTWAEDIYRFTSTDLKNWKRELVIKRDGDEHLFNCSVCKGDQGYVMAFESNKPVKWCFKFARSKDLAKWEKIKGLVYTGENNEFSACPMIRYHAPYYYVIYVPGYKDQYKGWVVYMTRSKDLENWELSPFNPILTASAGEGKNNSDVDLFEWQGNTYLYYATGDQATWSSLRVAMYAGPEKEFFESHFPAGVKFKSCSAKRK